MYISTVLLPLFQNVAIILNLSTTFLCVCIYVTHIYVCMPMPVCVRTYACVYPCIHVYPHAYMCCVYVPINVHICAHTHAYVCVCVLRICVLVHVCTSACVFLLVIRFWISPLRLVLQKFFQQVFESSNFMLAKVLGTQKRYQV